MDSPPCRCCLRPRAPALSGSRGRTALVTDPDGFISEPTQQVGLWVDGTRMISQYRWSVRDRVLVPAGNAWIDQYRWLGYFLFAPPNAQDTPAGETDPAQESVELRLSRALGAGMHEDLDLTNHTQVATRFGLCLEIDADFVDLNEVGKPPKIRGTIAKRWSRAQWVVEYRAEHEYQHQGQAGTARLQRGISLTLQHPGVEPSYDGKRIQFEVKLAPHASWHLCLSWRARTECVPPDAPNACAFRPGEEPDRWRERSDRFRDGSTQFRGPVGSGLAADVVRTLARASDDLAALRLFDLDQGEEAWTFAAGIPDFLAFFGRDTVLAATQAGLVGPEPARGTLTRLAKWQAKETDDWRDAQPGRLVHELHTNPLSVLRFDPHGRYFGDVTVSLLYPWALARFWRWSGDRDTVAALLDNALGAIEWADRELLVGGVPFYRYQTRSEQGEKNQGWKDSNDALVYPDGTQVEAPIGTSEMQGFAYRAKRALAGVLEDCGRPAEATRLRSEAGELKRRFNDFFWMPEANYYGAAVGPRGELVRSITSGPGVCLGSGIVDDSKASRVAHRLLASDLFSGWGLRTLSALHPAHNPFAYHRGTVWPAENALVIAGLARHGLYEQMHALCRAQFELAAIYEGHRLPEVVGGHPRDEAHPFPGFYPAANWPQAWSASAVLGIVHALLGIRPRACRNAILLDPQLPDWLPELTVLGVRVGGSVIDVGFRRTSQGTTEYEVLANRGGLRVVRGQSLG